jgi:hypothetical protein
MRSLSLQLVKKFSYCYETRKYISVRKSWSVERGESIHNVTSYFFNGHFNIMGEERKVYRVLVENPEGKRPLGRPRHRWDENGFYGDWLGGMEWIQLAHSRGRWRDLVNTVMKFRVLAPRS